jgi:hypothetical protein
MPEIAYFWGILVAFLVNALTFIAAYVLITPELQVV